MTENSRGFQPTESVSTIHSCRVATQERPDVLNISLLKIAALLLSMPRLFICYLCEDALREH